MCSLCLVFEVTGSDLEATTALHAGGTDTGFLGRGEKRALHRRRHSVLSTLDPNCWLLGQRPSSRDATAKMPQLQSSPPGGMAREGENGTDTFGTAECVQCRLAQGCELL